MHDYPENIKYYLDSTFLKTSFELGVSDDELRHEITNFIIEAIDYQFKCVMIRPNFVTLAKELKDKRKSKIIVEKDINEDISFEEFIEINKLTIIIYKDGFIKIQLKIENIL